MLNTITIQYLLDLLYLFVQANNMQSIRKQNVASAAILREDMDCTYMCILNLLSLFSIELGFLSLDFHLISFLGFSFYFVPFVTRPIFICVQTTSPVFCLQLKMNYILLFIWKNYEGCQPNCHPRVRYPINYKNFVKHIYNTYIKRKS